ncbi:uncharacterized protein LOC128189161 [Crassostrea angulata]|uniref:uncharacterized protein LOC128189161 n=1 Tax=Magallana angulata TaxID=2784310 RepID=UPI0022B14F67|nr:uncharacterized protein LOC128189161 [Crassostrea angulata]XP_052716616.1 uncharacterized protein LOC128189161 [Crassostrea angulata]XP_052716617.1 uncharacterized protein LOC128189161 [Crassostrea angulata]XP_052716618.1 uncharacterized protein LOC128189161 [Crassostrea angulata]
MVFTSTISLIFCISIQIYSGLCMSANSCIVDSLSIKHEKTLFNNMTEKGKNLIFITLNFNQSYMNTFLQNKTLERWVWVANDYRYILSYPEDVDVFSFGLLKAKQDSLEVKMNILNITGECERHFYSYIAQYVSQIVQNSTKSDFIIDASKGYICHSRIVKDVAKEYISNISAVNIGYPFLCYTNNSTSSIEKSYVNYIVIFIVLFTYCFYPLAMEMAFYIEDRKMSQGCYYMSESPYGPSVFCKRILFAGNNKYLATLRVILIVTVLTTLVYYIKSEVFYICKCVLKSSNDNQSFRRAENIYINSPELVFWGAVHFVIINVCVLMNSDGILDDFVIFDISNICNHGTILKTVKVSAFLTINDERQNQQQQQDDHDEENLPINERKSIKTKHLVSYKIRKIFLILSFSFWSKIFFHNSISHEDKQCIVLLQSILCFPVNVILVFGSTFCPVVFTVYVFFVKYLNVIIGKLICKISSKCCKRSTCCERSKCCKPSKALDAFLQTVSHIITISYLFLTYRYTFNIFFYGMSYVIQFFIFTVFLAVPHFSIQSYIYIIFITSVIIYTSRFVFQFIDLYRSLLEKILDIQDKIPYIQIKTKIRIEHFDEIVEKHFPLSNEIFYLFVKIMFSCLFFAILYDTMQTVGYIRSGEQPDLTTVISFIFLFGPPRLVEALLMTDFTSRVHMKETKIRKDLETILESNIEANEPAKTIFTDKERNLCCMEWLRSLWSDVRPENSNVQLKHSDERLSTCTYNPKLFWLRWLCMFCCGCCNCIFDGKGYCECAMLNTGVRSPANSTNKDEESKYVQTTTLKIPCVCIEEELSESSGRKDKSVPGTSG